MSYTYDPSQYYGPTNEDAKTIEYERNFVAGDVVVGTGYGIQLLLYTNCALFLWKRRKHGWLPSVLLIYMTAMLLIESLFIAVQARTVQMIYIDNRNFPGGPWQFFLLTQFAAVNVIFDATLFVLTFLSDLLVLWRCWVIWAASGQTKLAWSVLIPPIIILVASCVMGTMWTIESTKPGLSFYSTLPWKYGTSYYALSLSANIILTLLIIGRLIAYRRTLLQSLPADLAKHYISLATVIIESAALYSIFAILFLATYAVGNPTAQIWLGVASSCQQIANLLIIYRLVEGSAWQQDTLVSTKPIHFRSGQHQGAVSTNFGVGRPSFHIGAPPVSVSDGSSDPASEVKTEEHKHEEVV
ncbi:hypothetical protein MVEN_01971900 [Mycena venus]|uniref:Uncharacterized protein n=1 Tax=Mycena venus TaxID=2733690 RepID=A0A8H6XD77_9AGAR|nr:hypothetical protein MVEN_01971900 [Mycena venus]